MQKGMAWYLTPAPPTVIKCSALSQQLFIYPAPLTMPRFPQRKSFEGWNRRASLITTGLLSLALSLFVPCHPSRCGSVFIYPLCLPFSSSVLLSFPLCTRPPPCFPLVSRVSLHPSTFPSRFHPLVSVTGPAGMKRPSPGMFHFDFRKFPARCQTFVDWIGLFTVAHRSFLSFFFLFLFPFEETLFAFFRRKIRRHSSSGNIDQLEETLPKVSLRFVPFHRRERSRGRDARLRRFSIYDVCEWRCICHEGSAILHKAAAFLYD